MINLLKDSTLNHSKFGALEQPPGGVPSKFKTPDPIAGAYAACISTFGSLGGSGSRTPSAVDVASLLEGVTKTTLATLDSLREDLSSVTGKTKALSPSEITRPSSSILNRLIDLTEGKNKTLARDRVDNRVTYDIHQLDRDNLQMLINSVHGTTMLRIELQRQLEQILKDSAEVLAGVPGKVSSLSRELSGPADMTSKFWMVEKYAKLMAINNERTGAAKLHLRYLTLNSVVTKLSEAVKLSLVSMESLISSIEGSGNSTLPGGAVFKIALKCKLDMETAAFDIVKCTSSIFAMDSEVLPVNEILRSASNELANARSIEDVFADRALPGTASRLPKSEVDDLLKLVDFRKGRQLRNAVSVARTKLDLHRSFGNENSKVVSELGAHLRTLAVLCNESDISRKRAAVAVIVKKIEVYKLRVTDGLTAFANQNSMVVEALDDETSREHSRLLHLCKHAEYMVVRDGLTAYHDDEMSVLRGIDKDLGQVRHNRFARGFSVSGGRFFQHRLWYGGVALSAASASALIAYFTTV